MSRKSKKPPARPTTSAPPPRAALLNLIRTLLLVALGVSAYLAWTSLTHGSLVGCGPESDCDRVLQSRWSRWFGVPVSVFAVLVDAVTLWGTFALGRASRPETRARGALVGTAGAMMILGAGVWFIALQIAKVGICPYCMAAHGAGVIASLLLLFGPGKKAGTENPVLLRAGFAATAALLVLIGGQFIHQPKTGREFVIAPTNMPVLPTPAQAVAAATTTPVSTQAVATPKTNLVAAQTPPATSPPPPSTNAPATPYTPDMGPVSAMKRPHRFYQGYFAVDLDEVPVIGSPTNAQAFVSLFDYSCHHCREMHPLLQEAQRAYSNELTIVSLPMPLDGKCNRSVRRTPAAHSNACEYARLGLGVWRASPAKHREFDEWLMTGAQPPPVAQAVERAASLVTTNALVKALGDPWIERQLQFDIAIYEVGYRQQHGRMPQLILGPTVFEGTASREELFKLITNNIPLKPRP